MSQKREVVYCSSSVSIMKVKVEAPIACGVARRIYILYLLCIKIKDPRLSKYLSQVGLQARGPGF